MKGALAAGAVLLFGLFAGLYSLFADDPLQVVFLDVGQGDAIFIRSPEGRSALIDGGRGPRPLMAQLEQLGVTHLDLVIATHADIDHIGGLAEAVTQFRPRFFMDNGLPHTTQAYERLLLAVEAAGSTYLEPGERSITLGSVTLFILPPPGATGDQNDNSVGVVLSYGDFRAVLSGDATTRTQNVWLNHYADRLRNVTVYKAAHHGSRTGDELPFLRAMQPRAIVISVGATNAYGHPHPEPLANYAAVNATVYRTDEHGAITFLIPREGDEAIVTTGSLSPIVARDPLGRILAWLESLFSSP